MRRTHRCGDLRAADIGQRVVLQGWVHRQRDHGGLIFIDLRDRTGWTQVVFNPQHAPEPHEIASGVRSEYVIEIEGEVGRRPAGTENAGISTGEIEVVADRVQVLNASLPPPFSVADEGNVEEPVRLTYRYLDLRRPHMAQNLVLRHQIIKRIRDVMDGQGFLEVETPILTKSTPEGARDYLVPSRVHPGEFYALPQAPQQFKQLLMVAGVDRYFQIARCFRDEDLRADRQPEFTQLDIEMSFVEQDDVLDTMEELLTTLGREFGGKQVTSPFPRLTYRDVMDRYGTDKPDLRYGMASEELSDVFGESEFAVFKNAIESGAVIRGICVPDGAKFSRRVIDELTEIAKGQGAKGLAWAALEPDGGVRSSFARFISPDEQSAMIERLGGTPGDLLLLVADAQPIPSKALGAVRIEVARRENLADPNVLAFARVTEMPLLEWEAEGNRWDAAHNPFSMPMDGDEELLDTDPAAARAKAYDIVCNGWELGSGSVRIHRRELQQRMFRMMGYSDEAIEERFGHMLRAFQYGAPPHGGMALGIDRIIAILADEVNIREVIAFPKNQSAVDLLMNAPSPVDESQLRDLHIALRLPPQTKP
ncbi:MAG: aspartyl-tRNA synthetase [Chloroflexota bacterium]|jgi:aspartyl-tRNA synthetase|nr:aspartyl-tRNA synthetase [Chloroflexota bacterium]